MDIKPTLSWSVTDFRDGMELHDMRRSKFWQTAHWRTGTNLEGWAEASRYLSAVRLIASQLYVEHANDDYLLVGPVVRKTVFAFRLLRATNVTVRQ